MYNNNLNPDVVNALVCDEITLAYNDIYMSKVNGIYMSKVINQNRPCGSLELSQDVNKNFWISEH